MSSHTHTIPLRAGSFVGESPAHLLPVLARAAELGRGPAGLVRLLRARGAGNDTLTRLAGELNRVVRRAGVGETLVDGGRPG